MDELKNAVRSYALRHADHDGLARTPISGFEMMCVDTPRGDLQAVYRPLVCVVLQGAKRMTVGRECRTITAGESVIVSADMPVVGRVVQASMAAPYMAVAVHLQLALIAEMAVQLDHSGAGPRGSGTERTHTQTVFTEDTRAPVLDCITRLMGLLQRPEAIPLLQQGLLRELHYWLMVGPHAAVLRALTDPTSHAHRIAAAISLLRRNARSRMRVEHLAAAANMSLTAFHKHFKQFTSLTPVQYQKRLRLIEARRLMLEQGLTATHTAYEVGYESVPQFTRDYRRLYGRPPKQDVRTAFAPPLSDAGHESRSRPGESDS